VNSIAREVQHTCSMSLATGEVVCVREGERVRVEGGEGQGEEGEKKKKGG